MSCSRGIVVSILLCIATSLSLYAQPDAGLVASWPFNGNANDATGRGLNGFVRGATPAMDRFGHIDSAYSFDGVNDYIEVPNSPMLNLNINAGITFSYWLQTCAPSGFGVVMERFNSIARQASDSGWTLGTMPSGNNSLSPTLSWRAQYLHDRTNLHPVLNDGKWHHVAVVVQPTKLTFYVDGVFERLILLDSTAHCCYNASAPIRIGAGSWGASSGSLASLSYFKGRLDDIRIYNRGMTELETRALYNESAWPISEQKLEIAIQPMVPTTICSGGEVQIKLLHNGEGVVWNTTNGVVNANAEIITLRPQTTTTYKISSYRHSYPCMDTTFTTDSITVTVASPPEISMGLSVSACASDTTVLGGEVTGGIAPYRWQWSPATGLDNPNAQHPKLINGPAGRNFYRVIVTDAKGCRDTAEVSVILFPSPAIKFSADTVYYCPGTGVRIGAEASSETRPRKYSWAPAQGLSRSDTSFVVASPKIPTRYILTVENITGCIGIDTIVVIPSPHSINLGDDLLICRGDSTSIGILAEPGITYEWTPTLGVSKPKSGMTTVAPTATTLYRLRATDTRTGCSVSDSILIRVYDVQLSADRRTIDFGSLNGCTVDSIISVQITNKGTMATRIEQWSSENTAFSLVDPNFFVPAGRTVVARIRYAPQEEGVHQGKLKLEFGSCNEALVLDVQGAKQKASISLVPNAIDFGSQASCDLKAFDTVISVVNSGTSKVTLTAVNVPPPYTITGPMLPITILPGRTQVLQLHYTPTRAGDFTTELELSYESEECKDVLHTPLAALVQEPTLQIDAEEIDFGLLDGCIFQRDTTILLRNNSATDITITAAEVPEGYVLMNRLPIVVPSTEAVPLSLQFFPSGNAQFSGTLRLTTDPCAGALSVPLRGEKQGVWFTLPDTLDFGELVLCADQYKSLPLQMLFSGEEAGNVRVTSITGPFKTTLVDGATLPIGIEQSAPIEFVPTGEGEYIGEMTLALEPCSIERRVVLRGKATQLELNGNNYALSIISNEAPVVADILFRNTGSTAAQVVQVQGVVAPFTLLGTTPALPAMLQPNEELRVTVRYTPFPDKAQSPVQVVMVAPCPLTTEVTIYANGSPGPKSVSSPTSGN